MDTIILNFLQAPGLSTAAVILLFNITLKSLFILCFVFLCTRMMRRASSAIRHLIWTTALAGILLLPILGAVLPTWNISVLPYSISQVPEARLEKAQDDSLQQPSSEFVLNGELDEKKGTSFDNHGKAIP